MQFSNWSSAEYRFAGIARLIVALAIVGVSTLANAQVNIPSGAEAGRERERFIEPPRPRAQPGGPSISLPSSVAPAGAKETRLVVRKIQVVGATVYSEEQLRPLYEGVLGHRVTLQEVYDVAQRITSKYGADGYVLSRAVVPPQELSPGGASIRIEVVEGYIDQVDWPRQKLARYRDFFTDYTTKIIADRPANIRTLERYLLLANDLPGLKFTTALKASKTKPGASTLVVEVTEKHIDMLARVDNRGTASRGPVQFLVSPTFNNVFGQHDQLTIAYAGVSPMRELQYIAPSWKQVLNSEGFTVFMNGSYSWGYPGTPALDVINFKTRSTYIEGGSSYPVIRSRERNLTLTALAFMSDSYSFSNFSETDPFNVDRLRGMRARADFDFADKLNGTNQVSATFSQGINGFGSTTNDNAFRSRSNGKVDFSKSELYATRLQPLVGPLSALISAYGQYAFTSLLAPEQCGYGGRFFGRAYDPSELLGDHCWEVSGELRYDVQAAGANTPSAQFYAYTDKGTVYTILPDVGTSASVTGASAGGGVRLAWQNYYNVDLSAAKAIEGPRNDWRFFFISTARY